MLGAAAGFEAGEGEGGEEEGFGLAEGSSSTAMSQSTAKDTPDAIEKKY